jgi:hypothetical protein
VIGEWKILIELNNWGEKGKVEVGEVSKMTALIPDKFNLRSQLNAQALVGLNTWDCRGKDMVDLGWEFGVIFHQTDDSLRIMNWLLSWCRRASFPLFLVPSMLPLVPKSIAAAGLMPWVRREPLCCHCYHYHQAASPSHLLPDLESEPRTKCIMLFLCVFHIWLISFAISYVCVYILKQNIWMNRELLVGRIWNPSTVPSRECEVVNITEDQ